jgi:tetratricopeptide (TPR) repeat protein
MKFKAVILLFFLVFTGYLFTLAPSITVGDSGELCASSQILGIVHSPGYPLYSLFGKLFSVSLPFASPAYRVNVMSSLFGALTACMLLVFFVKSAELLKITGLPVFAFAAVFLAISPAFWRSSIQAEVFTLNTFFAALIMLSIQSGNVYLASFLFGLGMGDHHTLLFIAPLIGIAVFKGGYLSIPRKALLAVLFFLVGFSVYFYLPIRASKGPALNWGDPQNLNNIYRVISRADYGSMALTVGEKISRNSATTLAQAKRFLSSMNDQFTVAGLLLGCLGWYFALKRRLPFAGTLLFCWCFAGPGFLLLANIPFDAQSEGILERFYILVNLFWAIAIGFGLMFILEKLKQNKLAGYGIISLLFIAPLLLAKPVNWRNYYLEYDYGKNILKTLAPGSIFLMDGGDDTFYSTAYLLYGEHRRPDVEPHDRGGLVFKSIYGPDFRRLTREEKEKRRQNVELALLRNNKNIVYSTFNTKVLPGVALVPEGVLYAPAGAAERNSWFAYSLRSVYQNYEDYRSRALVPLYPYFGGLHAKSEYMNYWEYALSQWPEVLWLKSNINLALINKAYDSFSAGRTDEAYRAYTEILKLFPDDVSSMVNLGVIESKRNNHQMAVRYYEKALAVNPKYTEAYYNLAVIYWQQNAWEKVIQNFTKLLEIDPDDARAQNYLRQARQKLESR